LCRYFNLRGWNAISDLIEGFCGTDESFFGEDAANQLRDLYTEKGDLLDDDRDEDDDLASLAMQVWNSASEAQQDGALRLPPLSGAARPCLPPGGLDCDDPGLIAYLRFPKGQISWYAWMTRWMISDWREEVWKHAIHLIEIPEDQGRLAYSREVEKFSIKRAQSILGENGLVGFVDLV
jgi:hypothetical protein